MKRSAYLLGALLVGFGVAEAQKNVPSNVLSADGQFNKEQQSLIEKRCPNWRSSNNSTVDNKSI